MIGIIQPAPDSYSDEIKRFTGSVKMGLVISTQKRELHVSVSGILLEFLGRMQVQKRVGFMRP